MGVLQRRISQTPCRPLANSSIRTAMPREPQGPPPSASPFVAPTESLVDAGGFDIPWL